MNPTDEEIDALAEELMGNREFRAADMLLALKARVEALEKQFSDYVERVREDLQHGKSRAEAAERLIENSGSALEAASLIARAEAAEQRAEELEARIRVVEHDHGINLSLAASRAEAAEERIAELEKREIELGELAWWLNARAKVPEADLRAALEGKL